MASSYDSMMAAKSFLPFRMGYLTDKMKKQAEEELNETKETRAEALAELRRLIAEEKDFDIRTDDSYLLQFLRVRKFKPKKAMEVIRNFYTTKRDFPDVYAQELTYEAATFLMNTSAAGVFPYRHKDGGAVFFFKIANWDPDQLSIELAVSAMTALILYVAEDPATQVCGSYLIYDAGYNLKQLRVITLSFLKLFSRGLRNTLPIRFKEIHIINESPVFRYLYNILKMFISEKIRKRFHFHGSDVKQLQKYIPKEVLPPMYGGDNISYSSSDICKKDYSASFDKYCEILTKGYAS